MKAVGLFSGGLDSILAVRLMLDQDIDVVAVHFTSPFCPGSSEDKGYAIKTAKALRIRIKIFKMGLDFLKVIKNAKYGFGSGMNPCVDCKIYMLKKAKSYAKEIGAKFLFTGEVLGERPMSQNPQALRIIEEESDLKGKIVRPLSAKLLRETEAEKKRWVDRDRLLDIRGRSRKTQIMLVKKYGITDYPTPAGGCLLTYKEFASKIRDLIHNKSRIRIKDILLLKLGRHFRFENNKIIVGRDETENKRLLEMMDKQDYFFEVPSLGSPISILQGKKSYEAIEIAASLTAKYSDAETGEIPVKYHDDNSAHLIHIKSIDEDELNKLRI